MITVAYRYDIYIGSDNGSGRIHRDYLDRILDWASSTFPDGYTIVRGRGYYNGAQEDSIILSVLSDYDVDLNGRVVELKESLGQESILLSKYPVSLETV